VRLPLKDGQAKLITLIGSTKKDSMYPAPPEEEGRDNFLKGSRAERNILHLKKNSGKIVNGPREEGKVLGGGWQGKEISSKEFRIRQVDDSKN